MEIKTKALGTVQIEEDQIITLSEGFYGFKKYHRFALLDAKQKPFIWIQSLDDAELAFIAIDPFIFRPDYELDIDDALLEPLGIESPTRIFWFVFRERISMIHLRVSFQRRYHAWSSIFLRR